MSSVLARSSGIENTFSSNELSLTRPGIGVPVLYLFFEGIVYFLLVFLVQVSSLPCTNVV